MTIGIAIGAITSTTPTAPTRPSTSLTATPTDSGGGFAQTLGDALTAIDASQTNADQIAQQVALGTADPGLAMVALTEAQLVVEMATAVRNRAVEAFNEIMRMPV